MDPERFDELIRTLGSGASRRGALTALSRGAFALVPLLLDFHGSDAKKKKKKKKKKKRQPPPPSDSPVGLSPVDAATRDELVRDANQFANHTFLFDKLTQERQYTPNGEVEAWNVLFEQDHLRKFLITYFTHADGRRAYLVYGIEKTGEEWTNAYLTEDGELTSVLTVTTGQAVRTTAVSSQRNSGSDEATRPRLAALELPYDVKLVLDGLADKCLWCEMICQLILEQTIDNKLNAEHVCVRFAATGCSKLGPGAVFAACAGVLWSACQLSILLLKEDFSEETCRIDCKELMSCQPCERRDCPAGVQYFSKQACSCQCVPELEDYYLDERDRPRKNCGGRCVETASDRQHCGSCAEECPPSDACNNVTCIASRCTFTPKQNGIICSDDGGTCIQGTCFPPTCGANQNTARYWNNGSLSGAPTLVACESWPIDHNWGTGSPGAGIPDNGFSARWTGSVHFAAGSYDFIAQGDDGIRVWLDNQLIIDQWTGNLPEARVTRQLSAGNHDLKVEYQESGGGAVARFRWEASSISCGANQYRAEYWDNRTLNGSPALIRCESWPINWRWTGSTAPGPGVPANDFSARWTGQAQIEADMYDFIVRGDDGIRVWLNDQLTFDRWSGALPSTIETRQLSSGQYDIKVEFREFSGNAIALFRWARHLGSICGADQCDGDSVDTCSAWLHCGRCNHRCCEACECVNGHCCINVGGCDLVCCPDDIPAVGAGCNCVVP